MSLINEVVSKLHNQISAVKAAVEMQGLKVGGPRLPSLPLDERALGDIESALRKASFPEVGQRWERSKNRKVKISAVCRDRRL
ncbi:hypothetical protein [Thermococcus sp. 4557]|uniref:hypothetical protein n=1 Tax=Thermococcus sp. (strain CGMCC 1.5172 / 4557) TaxID=1042877 RepID=UPI0011D2353D|nr:hypothetical protein [Thermococcus sp. 4557]